MTFLELPLRNYNYLVNVKEIKAVYVSTTAENCIEISYTGGGSNLVYLTFEEFKQRLHQIDIDIL